LDWRGFTRGQLSFYQKNFRKDRKELSIYSYKIGGPGVGSLGTWLGLLNLANSFRKGWIGRVPRNWRGLFGLGFSPGPGTKIFISH